MTKRAAKKTSAPNDAAARVQPVPVHANATTENDATPLHAGIRGRTWVAPLWAGVVSLLAGWVTVGRADISVPWDQSGDNLFMVAFTKTLAAHPWAWENPQLGLPAALDFRVMPVSDTAHIAVLKLFTLLGMGPFTAINAYFLVSFGLIGATAAWVLQRTGLRGPMALLGGLLYALLPYHCWRGTLHLFLGAYYNVPVYVFLMLACLGMLDKRQSPTPRTALILSFAMAAWGGYYAFFFCYLLAFAVGVQALARRSWQPVWLGKLVAATAVGLVVNVAPAIWFRLSTTDPGKMVRPLQDTEVYALKFVQMLLPLMGHRTEWLAKQAMRYNRQAPMVNENQSASLGLVMSVVCLVVLVAGCVAVWSDKHQNHPAWSRVRQLALVAASAFLFATLGGVSAIQGFFISPFIRSSNRMSVFIAFFILVIAGWLVQIANESRAQSDGRKALAWALGILCAGIAIWDTADVDYFPQREASAAMYKHDVAFFSTLQSQVAPHARVFQVPFVRFPEGGLGTPDYYHFRPYLHTEGLQWSFGTLTGSQAESWNVQTAAMVSRDPQGFVQRLRQAGFTGVLLARSVPSRDSAFSEAALVSALGTPALESATREFAFFKLSGQQ